MDFYAINYIPVTTRQVLTEIEYP